SWRVDTRRLARRPHCSGNARQTRGRGGVPTAPPDQCQMAHSTPRMITIKNLISASNPHLPKVSCVDRLNWQMAELTQLTKSGCANRLSVHQFGCRTQYTIESNESSKCVGCQGNLVAWKSRLGVYGAIGAEGRRPSLRPIVSVLFRRDLE